MHGEGSIYQRKDGRWVGKYYVTDPLTGKTKPKYVYSSTPKIPKEKWKKDAKGELIPPPHRKGFQEVQRKLNKLKYEVESGNLLKTENITVKGWLTKYVEVYCDDLAITTKDGYKRYVYNHIIPVLGHFKLSELLPIHIENFYNMERKMGYSEKTILQIHRILNRAFKKAKGNRAINYNPLDDVDAPSPKEREPDIYTEDEFLLLLEKLEGHKLEPIVLLAGMCGLRRGELMGLTWEDIDFESGIINIERNTVPTSEGVVTKDPKTTKGKRRLAIPPGVLSRLKQIRGIGKIFLKDDGTEYHPSTVSRQFRVFLEKHNLRHIRLHDLRHFNATMMLKYGVTEREAQERLGHSNGNMTKKYQHILKEMDTSSAEKINKVLYRENKKQPK